jgi:type I restriction enzyme S subunit
MKAAGSSVLNLNKELVRTVELCFPKNIVEQKAISKILADIDDDIINLELKLNKCNKIKQGMMQELLTGKTRLI